VEALFETKISFRVENPLTFTNSRLLYEIAFTCKVSGAYLIYLLFKRFARKNTTVLFFAEAGPTSMKFVSPPPARYRTLPRFAVPWLGRPPVHSGRARPEHTCRSLSKLYPLCTASLSVSIEGRTCEQGPDDQRSDRCRAGRFETGLWHSCSPRSAG
jgi:hypothetical protein